ncbi:MAG TPA: hypothetical protein VNZ86_14485 [Bacteroidia bacterium]|nr:hypothetical protein [Bacteroidia bacterium]
MLTSTSLRISVFIVCTFFFIPAIHGQEEETTKIKQWYKQEKFDEIIRYKSKNPEDLPGKALYYKGMAYYMKQEDGNALKYLDLAIVKGPVDGDMFYYKAMLLFYGKKLNEALPYFDKAIALLPDEPDFYAGKGDTYNALDQKDSAIACLGKAARLPTCKTRIFLSMGEIYQDLKQNENALGVYKTALGKLRPTDESCQNCSYNVGLLQELTGKYEDARVTLEKHVSDFQDD